MDHSDEKGTPQTAGMKSTANTEMQKGGKSNPTNIEGAFEVDTTMGDTYKNTEDNLDETIESKQPLVDIEQGEENKKLTEEIEAGMFIFGKKFMANDAVRASYPNIEQIKEPKHIGHQANIDQNDKGQAIEEIDYTGLDTPVLEQKKGQAANLQYILNVGAIRTEYPYAKLAPNQEVPIADIMKGNRNLYVKPIAELDPSKILNDFINNANKKANEERTKNKQTSEQATDMRKEVDDYSRMIAGSFASDYKSILDIALTVGNKRVPVGDKRSLAEKYFFLPKNCTGIAMSLITISHVDNHRRIPGQQYHNVPSVKVIEEVAKKLGYDTIKSFVDDVEQGKLQKALRMIKKIVLGTSQKTTPVGDLLEHIGAVDTELAKRDSKFNKMKYIDFEDQDIPIMREDGDSAIVDDLQHIISSSKTKLKLMPFVHGVKYTYNVLYYAYLNKYNFILPFGLTIPESTWVYIFCHLIDPNNMLKLRMSPNDYVFKIGGIGLLEKFGMYKETSDDLIRTLFKPVLTEKGNKHKLKNVFSAAISGITQAQFGVKKLMELDDKIGTIEKRIASCMVDINGIIATNGMGDDIEYTQRIYILKSLVESCLDKETDLSKLLQIFFRSKNLQYVVDRPTMNQLLEAFSFSAFSMASTMLKYATLWRNGDSVGGAWFVNALLKHEQKSAGHFSLILQMLSEDAFSGIVTGLFNTISDMETVKKSIKRAKHLIRDEEDMDKQRELYELLGHDFLTTNKADMQWSELMSRSIAEEHKTLSSALNIAFQEMDKEKAEEASQNNKNKEDSIFDDKQPTSFSGEIKHDSLLKKMVAAVHPKNFVSDDFLSFLDFCRNNGDNILLKLYPMLFGDAREEEIRNYFFNLAIQAFKFVIETIGGRERDALNNVQIQNLNVEGVRGLINNVIQVWRVNAGNPIIESVRRILMFCLRNL